eukprot:1158567-Pelagomonas_calceolata.AAC.1
MSVRAAVQIQSILKVWKVHQIGNGGGRFRCARPCLFPSQPSSIVERITDWASVRNTGIGQNVILRLGR